MSWTPGDAFLGHINTGRFLSGPGFTGSDSSLHLASVKADLHFGADQACKQILVVLRANFSVCLRVNQSGEVEKNGVKDVSATYYEEQNKLPTAQTEEPGVKL